MTADSMGNGGAIPTRERSMNHPGFYSLVRFCPDIERGEAVNVGVIIGAPGLGMRVRMAKRNEYVKRRFGAEAFDNTRLTLVKNGLAHRLEEVPPTAEALAAFGAAEAGKLQISTPRPMVVSDLDGEVLALFQRLVQDPEIHADTSDATGKRRKTEGRDGNRATRNSRGSWQVREIVESLELRVACSSPVRSAT